MAEFKKYTTPGSFGQNQLKRPSEVAKITKETARRSRGMQRAQDFEQRSRAVYLRAQQFAQSQEQEQRENNFRIETENRQAYKDALTRDYEIERANAEAEGAAYQKALRDLTEFSTTAAELAVDYAKSVKEANDSAAKDNIYKAGITYDKLAALQSLNDNLTRAELFQTQFMQDVLKNEDLTESQKDAYYKTYQGRNTKAYVDNQVLLQQEAGTYISFLDAGMSADDARDLSPQEKIDLIPQLRAQFLNTDNLKNQRGELLESSGLYRTMRGIENQLTQQLQQEVIKRREEEVEFNLQKTIIKTYREDGALGVMRLLAENPSKDMRVTMAMAFEKAALGGGPNPITADDVARILNAPTDSNGTLIPYRERFETDDSVVILNQLRSKISEQQHREYTTRNKILDMKAEQKIEGIYKETGVDGFFDEDEIKRAREVQDTEASPGYVSPLLEEMERLSIDNRATEEMRERLNVLAESGQLTMARLSEAKLNLVLKKEFEPIAIATDKLRVNPLMDESIQRIRDLVSSHPKVAPGVKNGTNKASVNHVQNKFEREYRTVVRTLTLSGETDPTRILQLAEAQLVDRVNKYLDSPAATDGYGRFIEYTTFMRNLTEEAAEAGAQAEVLLDVLRTNKNVDKDPSVLVNALQESREVIIDSFDSYYKDNTNWAPVPVLQSIAKRLNMDTFALYNFIAPALKKDPLVPKNDTLQQIKKNLKPHLQRNFDVYPTSESIARSTAVMYGRTANLPVRPAFEQSGLLPLIRGGEAGGNYNAANRGFAGDTPEGIVNLDTLTVANWNSFYATGYNALGAYQLIRSTFQGAVKRLGLARDTIMDKKTQDLIAIELIAGGVKRPALSAYLNGKSDDLDAAVKGLYREWAAIATETGNSEYDGLAGNAANVSNDEAREALQRLRQMLTSTQ